MTDPWLIQNKTNYCNDQAEDSPVSTNEVEQQPKEKTRENTPTAGLEFEDNFAQFTENEVGKNNTLHEPLPDSASYLLGLERKLQRLKKGPNLVEALAEKRQDCLRTLLLEGDSSDTATTAINALNNNALLALDTPISNGDSTVQEIYRHLNPVQPVTVGETVHIVKYDHLDETETGASSSDEETKGADRSGTPSN